MRVLLSVMPFAGHVAPVTGVVAELIARGHEVCVYTGSRYAERFAALGARTLTWHAAPDFDEHDLPATFPGVGRPGPLGLLANLEQLFIRSAVGQANDLKAELDGLGYDLLVGDVMSLGAGLAAELAGTPWATLSIVPLSSPSIDLAPTGAALPPPTSAPGRIRARVLRGLFGMLSGRLDRAHREVRETLGLAAPARRIGDAWYSPELVLACGSAGIEYPRSDLGPEVHFVGRLAPAGSAPIAIAPAQPAHPTQVIVTQGTFNVDPGELIVPTLKALADRDVTVVATTGRRGVTDVGVPVPPNASVVDFARFGELLPGTAVFISNGGWGGVLEVLAAGVPVVVAGGDLDKPEIAARVAWSGAGIDLRTGRPSPKEIAAAVDRVLADPTYRANAQRIARELAPLGGAASAVDLLEAFAGSAAQP
jgi:MGT family glycosyltransferase